MAGHASTAVDSISFFRSVCVYPSRRAWGFATTVREFVLVTVRPFNASLKFPGVDAAIVSLPDAGAETVLPIVEALGREVTSLV